MVARFLRVLESHPSSSTASWGVTAALYYYTRLYGAQLVLITLLSAVTVYRREMSCNRVYTEGDRVKSRRKGSYELSDRWEESTEDLLEGAGAYCSGEPLYAVALSLWTTIICFGSLPEESKDSFHQHERASVSFKARQCSTPSNNIVSVLPSDVQVHVLTYLHPKDVVNFACASRSCRDIVDTGETSLALWRTLWHRDYAWVVHSWSVGRNALSRSQPLQTVMNKQFYFWFGQSYMNYVLAAQNTMESCLIGLHGHIYDLSLFLHAHPGSPDTLRVQAGKDATRYFEDMNHSSGARRLALSMCVLVDGFCFEDGCGLHPTSNTEASHPLPSTVEAPTVPMTRVQRRPGNLQSVRSKFLDQESQIVREMTRRFASNPNVLSHVNVYYDPFQRKWKGWYTDKQFETVYVDGI